MRRRRSGTIGAGAAGHRHALGAGKEVAIFNVDGTIYAMEDSCLHKGASLGTGELDGKVVTCRAHGWRYDVTTGSTISSPGYGVTSYPAKVIDGKILVAV